MKRLTARQTEILNFIREELHNRGFPPTIAEIATAMRVKSPNGIRDHLQALARNRGLPIIGRVAAGNLILAQQHIEVLPTRPQPIPASRHLSIARTWNEYAGCRDLGR